MRTLISLCFALTLAGAEPAAAASRNFGVSGFERIRVEGPFAVRVTTGVAPFARAIGSPRAIDRVKVEMQGRTMVIRIDRSSSGNEAGENSEPVEVLVGTHELNSALLSGSGSLDINKVRGLSFTLSVQGSGSSAIDSVSVDQLQLSALGSGHIRLAGSAAKVSASLRGTSSLEATALATRDATFDVEGPGTVVATVSGTARIDAKGAGSVKLSGSPACTSRLNGSASVSGCRAGGFGGR